MSKDGFHHTGGEKKKPLETPFLSLLFNMNVTMEMKNKHWFPLTPSMTGNLPAEMFPSKGKNHAGNCSEEHEFLGVDWYLSYHHEKEEVLFALFTSDVPSYQLPSVLTPHFSLCWQAFDLP